ncbi:MAG: hypothetical protein Fues2KO_24190 [Fuerstiella sp.]
MERREQATNATLAFDPVAELEKFTAEQRKARLAFVARCVEAQEDPTKAPTPEEIEQFHAKTGMDPVDLCVEIISLQQRQQEARNLADAERMLAEAAAKKPELQRTKEEIAELEQAFEERITPLYELRDRLRTECRDLTTNSASLRGTALQTLRETCDNSLKQRWVKVENRLVDLQNRRRDKYGSEREYLDEQVAEAAAEKREIEAQMQDWRKARLVTTEEDRGFFVPE